MAAAVVCLVFNSVPVSFGAVGTPILVGFGLLKDTVGHAVADGQAAGAVMPYANFDGFCQGCRRMGHLHARADGNYPDHLHAWLHDPLLGAGTLLERGIPGLEILYFFAAVCFLVPYIACAWGLGPEFPAMLGGLIGLGIVVWGAKMGFCVPKEEEWGFGDPAKWDATWSGTASQEYQHTFPGAHEPVHGPGCPTSSSASCWLFRVFPNSASRAG